MEPSVKNQFSQNITDALELLNSTDRIREVAQAQGDAIQSTGFTAEETFDIARDMCGRLRFALDQGLLDRLPQASIQQVRTQLEHFVSHLRSITQGSGFNAIVEPFRQFHASLWNSNLLSYLGLVTEQPDAHETRLQVVVERLEALHERAKKAEANISDIERERKEAVALHSTLDSLVTTATQASTAATDHSNSAAANKNQTDTYQKEAKGYSSNASEALAEVNAHKKQILEFFTEISMNREKLDTAISTAKTSLESNSSATSTIVNTNRELQTQIDEILQKAIGASLFHAFDTRRRTIRVGKWVWAGITVASVAVTIAVLFALANQLEKLSAQPQGVAAALTVGSPAFAAFLLKLLSTPLAIWAIFFASKQYSKERELEEQYAFKSAKAVSVEPYRRLVGALSESESQEKEKAFVERALDGIFEDLASLRPDVVKEKVIKAELKSFTESAKELFEAIAPFTKDRR